MCGRQNLKLSSSDLCVILWPSLGMEPVNMIDITPVIILPYMTRDSIGAIKFPNQLNLRLGDDLDGSDLT